MLVLVFLLDTAFSERRIISEGAPNFSLQYLLRSIGICLAVVLATFGFTNGDRPMPVWTIRESAWVLGTGLFSIALLILLAVNPHAFSQLTLEDGPIEWGSAILLFAASGVFLTSFFSVLRACGLRRLVTWLTLMASGGLSLIALEEISWFQRVIGFDTPTLFEGNDQGEMNLHNFNTNTIENAYYFGAYLFLILAPFYKHMQPSWLAHTEFELLIPKPYLMATAATVFAFNYDMWNVVYTQVAFFGTLTALLVMAGQSGSALTRAAYVGVAMLTSAAQLIFLQSGDAYLRMWEVTEYKEFLIPLALLAYSVDVRRRVNDLSRIDSAYRPAL